MALWLVARFPELLPATINWAVLQFGLSLALVWAMPGAVTPLVSSAGLPALGGVLLVFAALVYAWIAVAGVVCCVSAIPRSGGRSRRQVPMERR